MTRIIAGIWLFSLIFKAPQLLFYRAVHKTSGTPLCVNTNMGTVSWSAYEWVQVFHHFLLPIVLAGVLYTRTCRELWRVDRVVHATMDPERSATQQRQVKELGKRKRAVKMMVVCVTLFFLCYAPKAILDIISILIGHDWTYDQYYAGGDAAGAIPHFPYAFNFHSWCIKVYP